MEVERVTIPQEVFTNAFNLRGPVLLVEIDRRFRQITLSVLFFIFVMPATVFAKIVPNLEGLHLSEVEAMPEVADVTFEINKVDSTSRQDEVLLQIPGPGSEFGTRQAIYLRVSNGVLVPDLRGKELLEAQEELSVAGIVSAVTQRPYAGVPNNLVAAQVPDAGMRIDASHQIVFLVVSKGTVMIPNLINLTHIQALERLVQIGLNGRIDPPNTNYGHTIIDSTSPSLKTFPPIVGLPIVDLPIVDLPIVDLPIVGKSIVGVPIVRPHIKFDRDDVNCGFDKVEITFRVTEHDPNEGTLVEPGADVTIYYQEERRIIEKSVCFESERHDTR